MELWGLLLSEGNLLEAEQFAKSQQLSRDTCDTSGVSPKEIQRFPLVLGEAAVELPGLGSGVCPRQELGLHTGLGSSTCPRPGHLESASERLLQTPQRAVGGICRAGSSLIRGMQMGCEGEGASERKSSS